MNVRGTSKVVFFGRNKQAAANAPQQVVRDYRQEEQEHADSTANEHEDESLAVSYTVSDASPLDKPDQQAVATEQEESEEAQKQSSLSTPGGWGSTLNDLQQDLQNDQSDERAAEGNNTSEKAVDIQEG